MYITVDIGGTKTNLVRFENDNIDSSTQKISIETSKISNYTQGIKILSEKILELGKDGVIDGVGIAIAGDVDPVQGVLLDSIHTESWNGKNVVNDLNKILNTPVKIENDAVCGALAELSNVTTRGFKKYVFISLGTGVGGTKIMKFSNSILVFPWDFGHMIVNKDGDKCLCGQIGCLEVYASGSGILNRYDKKLEEINDKKVWDDLVNYTAQALMNFLVINPIDKIIFGGGISFKKIGLIEEIENATRKMSESVQDFPQFELARFYQEAQAVGALQLFASNRNIINMNYY